MISLIQATMKCTPGPEDIVYKLFKTWTDYRSGSTKVPYFKATVRLVVLEQDGEPPLLFRGKSKNQRKAEELAVREALITLPWLIYSLTPEALDTLQQIGRDRVAASLENPSRQLQILVSKAMRKPLTKDDILYSTRKDVGAFETTLRLSVLEEVVGLANAVFMGTGDNEKESRQKAARAALDYLQPGLAAQISSVEDQLEEERTNAESLRKQNLSEQGVQVLGQVHFHEKEAAERAMKELDGSTLGSNRISLKIDPRSSDATSVIVSGLDFRFSLLEELKNHFGSVGNVESVRQGVGEVQFKNGKCALKAIESISGTTMTDGPADEEHRITVVRHPSSIDGLKVLVLGLPPSCRFAQLKDHFRRAGKIVFGAAPGDSGRPQATLE